MRKAVIFLVAIIGASSSRSAEDWRPQSRPDRAVGRDWQFVGCESGAIDFSCWAGDLFGHVCRWTRTLDAKTVVREERYMGSGRFYLAYERTDDGAEEYRIVFFDQGRAHFRVSAGRGRDGLYHADVVVRGVLTARYVSAWDRIIADNNGELSSVPMDTKRVSGGRFAPLETFHARQDEHAIRALREDGLDLSRPRPVEFGFWFEEDHRATAADGLEALG